MSDTTQIADDLERLCCAETEAKFFDYVTESIGTIIAALRDGDRLRAASGKVTDRWLNGTLGETDAAIKELVGVLEQETRE